MLVPGSTLDTKNPWLFQPHGWPYISVFLYPWIQPMAYHVVLKPFMEKKKQQTMYQWMHMVQTHVIQRSTLICYSVTLKIRCIPKCYRKLLCFLKRMYTKTKNDFFCHK